MFQLNSDKAQGKTVLAGDTLPDELKNLESFDISAKFEIDTFGVTLGTVDIFSTTWANMKCVSDINALARAPKLTFFMYNRNITCYVIHIF